MRRPIVLVLATLTWIAPTARAATLTVTNLNDSLAGSLRQALSDAAPGDTIRFAPGLTGTITVTSAALAVFRPVTIEGPGATLLALSGGDTRQVLAVYAGELRLSGLTIRNGNWTSGAGMYNGDSLVVTRCTFSGNHATQAGGAIQSDGVLVVNECTFENNRSDTRSGSAIRCDGPTTVSASTFRANAGSAITATRYLIVDTSTFYGNSGTNGGALSLGAPQQIVR